MMKKYFSLVFLFLTFDSHTHIFLENFKQLKSSEWEKICTLGNQALKNTKITPIERAEIHALLASNNYYLGNYESMKQHIDTYQSIASTIGSTHYLIRSQYLLSAYHRIHGNFLDAKTSINNAISLCNKDTPDTLKAKVFFNAGAAHADDPKGSPEQAAFFYKKALNLLDPSSDDSHRTQIRLAKSLILLQKSAEAKAIIHPLFNLKLTPRTYVHLLYISAQLDFFEGKKERASTQIEKAIMRAKDLKMVKDMERLETLRKKMV